MYACNSSRSLPIELRFIGLRMVEGIWASLGVGMGLMWGVGMGLERNIFAVEVGGAGIGRSLETRALIVSPVGLEAF